MNQLLSILLTLMCLLMAPVGFAQDMPPAALPDEGGSSQPLSGEVYQADYVLGTGDSLNIRDSQAGMLLSEGKILMDGSLHLPLLGKVYLGGMSLREAKQLLNERYGRYFVRPQITVQIVKQHPARVYVVGAVSHPGVYLSGKLLSPGSRDRVELGDYNDLYFYPRLYLTDALLQAGGLNYNANVTDIRIRRAGPNPVVIHVNLMELFEGSTAHDISLRDQDVIEVEALADNQLVASAQWEQLADTNLGPGRFSVNVLGAVQHPGAYEMRTRENVLAAISKAGGFGELADKKTVYILRTTLSGQVIKRELNLTDRKMMSAKPIAEWAVLLPNDMIYVQESTALKVAKGGAGVANRAATAAMYPLFFNLFRKDSD